MNKETAEKLLNDIEIEMKNTGGVSFQTSTILENVFKSIGKDFLDYLYMENGKLIFNSRRLSEILLIITTQKRVKDKHIDMKLMYRV